MEPGLARQPGGAWSPTNLVDSQKGREVEGVPLSAHSVEMRDEPGDTAEPGGGQGSPTPADGIIGKEELFLQSCAQAPGCGSRPDEPFLPFFLEGSQSK